MPKNTKMISNEDALRRGHARALWKRNMTLDYFNNQVKYKINQVVPFDHRDIFSLVPLLIDISSVANQPDEIKKEYFLAKLQVIEQDFVLTKDPKTRLPYLKRMYETVKTDCDIDWDDEAQIDHLFCSTLSQQMLGMMVERLPEEVLSLYHDKEGAKKLDDISLLNYVYTSRFQNAVSRKYKELNKAINLGTGINDTQVYHMLEDIDIAISSPTLNKGNVATFDPYTLNESTRRYFLDGEIKDLKSYIPNAMNPKKIDVTHHNTNEFIDGFANYLYGVHSQTVNEFRVAGIYTKDSTGNNKDLVFINGKSASELVAEKQAELGDAVQAEHTVAEMLRSAMTDGKSVVTLMRPKILEGGKVAFIHQELKVDLDKLNQVDREQNHNVFRRALDYVGLFKIRPRFVTNEERDANQASIKDSIDYKNALKSAEEKFVKVYNSNSQKIRDNDALKESKGKHVVKNKFVYTYPEVSIEEEENELDNGIENEQNIEDNAFREHLPSVIEAIEGVDHDVQEPIHEENLSKSVDLDTSI